MSNTPALLSKGDYHLVAVVRAFMGYAGQTTDQLNVRQAALYFGLQLEEMAEKLEAIFGSAMVISALRQYSESFKAGSYDHLFTPETLADLLDADIDLAWVSIGAAMSLSHDASGAMTEVGRANLDKFPDGQAVRDANGKVVKPIGWVPPNLKPYVPTLG